MQLLKNIIILLMSLIFGLSCSSNNSDSSTAATIDSSVTGKLSSLNVSSLRPLGGIQTYSTKTITHVMAVSPSTGNVARYVSAVDADGRFSLGLSSGKPYIIVFIAQDGVLSGPDMIVGIVKVTANDLDTLPLVAAATVSLGDVSVNGTNSQATPSTTVSDLLSSLGMTSAEASYIGSVDDLALRLANPDVNNSGVIDANEGLSFSMDWHVRATTLKADSSYLRLSDIENAFPAASDVVLSWSLASGYAVYPTSFDDSNYVGNSGVDTSLTGGASFLATGTAVAATSMSGGTFGSSRQWGPDYNMATQEIGASDAASTFTYTLGTTGKVLKFSNVRTKTKAQLNADGVMIPFIKMDTSGGKLTGISYKWMKRSGSTWADATATEVGLIVQSSGAFLHLYTAKSAGVQDGLGFTIPATSATGTIAVSEAYNTNVADITNLSLNSFCSVALSYDDKMGLRLFAGSPTANSGVTTCN